MAKSTSSSEPESSDSITGSESKNVKPRCFVIMPISDHSDYTIGHFSRVYSELIKPAVEDAGFECKRVDDDVETKVIILNILRMVTEYDMAICDMSSLNPNVMYELGVRQMSKRPVTLIKDERTRRIFDTGILSDIEYDSSLRIDLVRLAKERITNSLRLTYEQRDKEANSLLDLLNMHVQVTSTDVNVTLPEKLILNQLEALSKQIAGLQNGKRSISNFIQKSATRSINQLRDSYGRYISEGDVIKGPDINSFYYVRAIERALGNDVQRVLLRLFDLKTSKTTIMEFASEDTSLVIVDRDQLRSSDPEQYARYVLLSDV